MVVQEVVVLSMLEMELVDQELVVKEILAVMDQNQETQAVAVEVLTLLEQVLHQQEQEEVALLG